MTYLLTYGCIKEDELRTAIRETNNDTAAAPANISLREIRKVGTELATVILNHWWATVIPTEVERCRTTLIPKKGDRKEVGNWRLKPSLTTPSLMLKR